MTIAKIILLFLKIADILLTSWRENKLMDAGADREIARASAAIWKKTQYAKEVGERVDAMDEKQIDELLHSLEPGGVPNNKR